MSDNNKHITDPDEFEVLMDQIFLELDFNDPGNSKILDAISHDVLSDRQIIPDKKNHIIKKIAGKINLNSILMFSVLSSIAIAIGFIAYFGDPKSNADKIVSKKHDIANSDKNKKAAETENREINIPAAGVPYLTPKDEVHISDKTNIQNNAMGTENITENIKTAIPANNNYVTHAKSDIPETNTGNTIKDPVKLPCADAINAIEIKDSIAGPFNVSLGYGLRHEYKSDFGEETNSAWFKFTMRHDTTLTFDIAPFYKYDNYDFVLFKCTSANGTGNNDSDNFIAVRECWSKWSYNRGMTGLSHNVKDTKVGNGPGPAYVSAIDVKAGETYYLMINYSNEYPATKIFPQGFLICFYNYSPQRYPTALGNISFEMGTAVLKTRSQELDKLAVDLKRSQTAIEIRAYTNEEDNERKNRILSEQRAKAIVDYLISKQINKSKLMYKGMGSYKPVESYLKKGSHQKINKLEYVRLMH